MSERTTVAPGAKSAARPYVPPIGPDELSRRNQEAVRLLDRWEAEGDADEQTETFELLR